MSPKIFGPYEVIARIATGGVASIFLARHQGKSGQGRLVCIKILLPERANRPEFVKMFIDEARVAARLRHPCCVKVYDAGRIRTTHYIAMEYLDGKTVSELIKSVSKVGRTLPAPFVCEVMSAVCQALRHAHELKDSQGRSYGVVHRDVCPSNIMVTFDGRAKLLDFGIVLAETARTPTESGVIKGKFSFMSPEQLRGEKVDQRSDLYSLGVVMFEALTASQLYGPNTPEELARRMLEDKAPRVSDFVPDIPKALDWLVAKALEVKPSERFRSAAQMLNALRDYLRTVPGESSSSRIATIMEREFGDGLAQRRQVLEEARGGVVEPSELLLALGGRPPMAVDLFDSLDGLDVELPRVAARDAESFVPADVTHAVFDMDLEDSTSDEALGDLNPTVRSRIPVLTGAADEFEPTEDHFSDKEVLPRVADPVDTDDTKPLTREQLLGEGEATVSTLPPSRRK